MFSGLNSSYPEVGRWVWACKQCLLVHTLPRLLLSKCLLWFSHTRFSCHQRYGSLLKDAQEAIKGTLGLTLGLTAAPESMIIFLFCTWERWEGFLGFSRPVYPLYFSSLPTQLLSWYNIVLHLIKSPLLSRCVTGSVWHFTHILFPWLSPLRAL